MLRRSARNVQKIDYKAFGTTGERLSPTNMAENLEDIILNESILTDQIVDLMEENNPELIRNSPELMMNSIDKVEALRVKFRTQHRLIKRKIGDDEYEEKYAKSHHQVVSSISSYIMDMNRMYQVETSSSKTVSAQKATFLEKEIFRNFSSLKKIATCDINKLSNDEVKSRKSELSKQSKLADTLSENFKEFIELAHSTSIIDEMQKKYDAIVELWSHYTDVLVKEVKSREVDKLETFNKTLLNIKLQSFSGYNSSIDFYTFKSNFMKLYEHSVPKSLQGDLLKNNHLENQALALVKNVTNIDEIWDRLKDAFGDSKTLLVNKLSELNNCDAARSKDPVKIVNSLSKITNLMRDLMQLSSDHNIENELYFSNALDEIYNLLGDGRTIRWLSISCDAPKEGKWKWRQLLEFLDKEIKIHQQRALSQTKKKPDTNKQSSKKMGGSSHHSASTNSNVQQSSIKCFICGKSDHVQTNGPRGMKLVQYSMLSMSLPWSQS